MNDYIYGVRREDGYVELDSEFTEQSARSWGNDVAIRIPVSAIEPLPAPKPALPTTPGSVIYTTVLRGAYSDTLETPRPAVVVHTSEPGVWDAVYTDGLPGWAPSEYLHDSDITGPWSFDAGAHDEGKTKRLESPRADEYMVQSHADKQCISWADAWRYFERLGYDMTDAGEQY